MKCPSCNQLVSGVHYEVADPSSLRGGSRSFVAVVTPCDHVISAVPMTWESIISEGQKTSQRLESNMRNLEYLIEEMKSLLVSMKSQ